jgi:hypothetical protein
VTKGREAVSRQADRGDVDRLPCAAHRPPASVSSPLVTL